MAHYTGALLAATLGATPLTGIREVDLPEEHPAPDVTHAADAHGQSIAGGITYRNGCTMAFMDDDGETVYDALVSGTTGTLVVYPEGNVAGMRTITMAIVITNRGRPIRYDDAVMFSVTFNVNSYAEGTVPA
jgi:hypothetical protein